jgi:RNA polymerase sigma-70 factor (TIGR02957 family)
MEQNYPALRPLLLSIAYRMLGSFRDAEDVVQEAFLRLHRETAAGTDVESVKAFLTTVTTRLAIDQLRSARRQREVYVGPWLPEPVVDEYVDLADRAALSDSLSTAFLLVLERLSPDQRAVFLLRDVFEYDYGRIAEIVGKSETYCRQILVRAKTHVREDRTRFETTAAHRDALAGRFFEACERGDLAGLEAILAEDITFTGDGGGKAAALATPAVGRTRVARFLLGLFRQGLHGGFRFDRVEVNGGPGAQIESATGEVIAVLSLDIIGDRIKAVYNVLNPDKLQHIHPLWTSTDNE